MIGVLVSARHDLTAAAAARASEWCDVIVRLDHGDFLGSLRSGFDVSEPAIKLDDDDFYAPDHGRIMGHYRGGVVWNTVKRFDCNGHFLHWRSTLSGAVIPPGLFDDAELDETGHVEPWIRRHHQGDTVWTGTRSIICPGRWLWGTHPLWLDRIACRHKVVA